MAKFPQDNHDEPQQLGFRLSGWDHNALKDITSVAFVQNLLAEDPQGRFYPQLASADKGPNYDGSFFVGKPQKGALSIVPFAQFEVQVKTLPLAYVNNGKQSDYKYSCNGAVFEAVLRRVSENPTLLIMVDRTKPRAYWRHLTPEYCMSLAKKLEQGSGTVYFNEADAIASLDSFYDQLAEIKKEHVERRECTMIEDDLPKSVKDELLKAIVELNRIMDNDLRFIKQALYPNAKQFGVACWLNGSNAVTKIYKIDQDEDGELVRSFELEPVTEGGYVSVEDLFDPEDIHVMSGPLDDFSAGRRMELFYKNQVERFFETGFLPASCLSDEILGEAAYYFLDFIALQFSYKRAEGGMPIAFADNAISVLELKRIWQAFFDSGLYALEIDYPEMLEPDKSRTFYIDPLSALPSGKNINQRRVLFEKALDSPLARGEIIIRPDGHRIYEYFEDVIAELEDRGIESLERPWPKGDIRYAMPDWLPWEGRPQIWRGYTTSEHEREIRTLAERLQSAYRFASRQLMNGELKSLIRRGRYVIYLKDGTRDPSTCTVKVSADGPFEITCTAEPAPRNPFDGTFDRACVFRDPQVDFSKMPLYFALEYMIKNSVCSKYGVHAKGILPEPIERKLLP